MASLSVTQNKLSNRAHRQSFQGLGAISRSASSLGLACKVCLKFTLYEECSPHPELGWRS